MKPPTNPAASASSAAFPSKTRAQALAAGAITPAALAVQRGVKVRAVLAAIRSGELPSFKTYDSKRALIAPAAARNWRPEAVLREALSVAAVAARFGVSPSSVWRAIREGKLPAFQPGGSGDLRIKLEDARTWVYQPRTVPPAAPRRRPRQR